jgi:hypothetical protein
MSVWLRVVRNRERNGRRCCWSRLLLSVRRRRGLLLLLVRGKRSEDDARVGCVCVFRLPLRTADRAADPFGRRGCRGRHRGYVGCSWGSAGVLFKDDLVPEDERGVLLYAYAGVRAHQ